MSITLGVKWSGIATGALALVDLVEVPGWAPDGPPAVSRLLHNLDLDFSLTTPGIMDDGWAERCRHALTLTGSPWFSLHLGFSTERVRFDNHMLPESPVLSREDCLRRMIDAVAFAQRHLPVPVLVENLDYCPEGAYEHVCEPEFISTAVRETGCHFLLDLAHARVSADWFGVTPEDYLSALPLDRAVELHLSGPRRVDGRLVDDHFELTEEDYRLLDWALARCRPRAVVLEYSRDPAALRDQLRRLSAILEAFGQAEGRA